MTFTNDTASKAAFKRLYGKAHTSNSKDIVNEAEGSNLSIAAQTIFADTIPSTGASAVSSGVAVAVTIPLVLDGSSAGKAYKATLTGAVPAGLSGKINPLTGTVYSTGQRVGYFVPEFLGADFRIRLRDGVTEIPPLASQDWIFDYYAGIITSEDNLSLSSGSIDGYVYIGALASDTAANWMRSGNDIYNRNSGTVLVNKDLIVGEDGYIVRAFGVGGDGYVTGTLGVGTTSPYDSIMTSAKLVVKNGAAVLDSTSAIQTLDVRGNSISASTSASFLAFGNNQSTTATKRIAAITAYPGSPYAALTGQLAFSTTSTAGFVTERMRIDEDGYVGIGISAPATLLHLQSSAPAYAGSTQGSLLRFDYNDTSWTAGDVVGAIEWFGNDISAGASGVRARLHAVAAGGTGETDLQFFTTTTSSSTLNAVLALTNTRRAGVLTTSPDTTLHVMASDASAASNANAVATIEKNGIGYLQILTPDADENGILFGLASNAASGGIVYNNSATLTGLQFRTGGNSTKMIIDSTGNVGIGTTSPLQKLHINGNVRMGTADADTMLMGDADLALVADSDVLIVSDVNQTGTPASDIIFGAGSSSTADNVSYATKFPGGLPLQQYMIIQGGTGNIGMGVTSPTERLVVNNGSAAVDIFVAQENGTTVFALTDGMSAPSANNSILTGNTSASASWKTPESHYLAHSLTTFVCFEDFVMGDDFDGTGFANNDIMTNGTVVKISGTGTAEARTSGTVVQNHPGVVDLGVTALNDFATLVYGAGSCWAVDTGQKFSLVGYFDIRTLNGADDQKFIFGVSSVATGTGTGGDPNNFGTDEVMLIYDNTASTWRSSVNGVLHTSGFTVAAGWNKLEVEFTGGGTTATFHINGVLYSRSSVTLPPTNVDQYVWAGVRKVNGSATNFIVGVDCISISLTGITRG